MAKVVYRVETEEGVGVYHHEQAREHIGDVASPRQPMPGGFLLSQECECRTGHYQWHECRLFAFPDLDALRRWFDDDARAGLRTVEGIAVSVYEAPGSAIRQDGYQATFMKCRATLRERIELPA